MVEKSGLYEIELLLWQNWEEMFSWMESGFRYDASSIDTFCWNKSCESVDI